MKHINLFIDQSLTLQSKPMRVLQGGRTTIRKTSSTFKYIFEYVSNKSRAKDYHSHKVRNLRYLHKNLHPKKDQNIKIYNFLISPKPYLKKIDGTIASWEYEPLPKKCNPRLQ